MIVVCVCAGRSTANEVYTGQAHIGKEKDNCCGNQKKKTKKKLIFVLCTWIMLYTATVTEPVQMSWPIERPGFAATRYIYLCVWCVRALLLPLARYPRICLHVESRASPTITSPPEVIASLQSATMFLFATHTHTQKNSKRKTDLSPARPRSAID